MIAAAEPPPSSGLEEDDPLPAAVSTINVSTAQQLTDALGSASNGAHIVLANGNYGTFTISRSGASGAPIVIRAANLLQPTFGQLNVNGSWVIVSGVTCSPLRINGSNVRVTRSVIQNASNTVSFGAGVTDCIVDHCDIKGYRDYMNLCNDPKNQKRLVFARNWIHDAVQASDGITQTFAWSTENIYREKHIEGIVRFNYVGPGLPNPNGGSDHVHNKVSSIIYAFNRWDTESSGNRLMHNRFGLNVWWIGNYGPNHRILMYDYDGWSLGNLVEEIRRKGGNSNLYDEEKNAIFWNGQSGNVSIFGLLQRGRLAGNQASIVLGHHDENFCNHNPQPMGLIKPQTSANGITYAADNPSDPRKWSAYLRQLARPFDGLDDLHRLVSK